MTIACCYVSPEGVVFGADSTSSYGLAGGPHYFNHAQKIFEIGQDSRLAIMTWGHGSLGAVSYRTIIAGLADDLATNPPSSVADAMTRWIKIFGAHWAKYAAMPAMKPAFDACIAYSKRPPCTGGVPVKGQLTPQEDAHFQHLMRVLTAGFCIGGYVLPDRTPAACFVHFDPLNMSPTASPIAMLEYEFWGAPNMIRRLLYGADDETRNVILHSGHWTGSDADLDAVLAQQRLAHPIIPLRDVVDFVHSCIFSTIKGLKFSHMPQICGGPIELAVVSSDRNFRWVRHKNWDAAVVDGVQP
ncbi:MAG TPA: hypothetical protein VEA80_04800 [Vitreimonas sp.]|uniref:hypothetical protein n=1 Tax=Vitreimonas sp. TaxID=3069702 RepID=UPI002D6F8416|nr:hypothetical protein [Vitreimonas sp.]HYD86770.1 hypothetical protein [Vitreimonas sp.]